MEDVCELVTLWVESFMAGMIADDKINQIVINERAIMGVEAMVGGHPYSYILRWS
jgi:hypothetical protein